VRPASPGDRDAVAELCHALWPESPAEEHARELESKLAWNPLSTLPLTIFVAEDEREIIGFAEVGLRSHADGCDPVRPVGFLEGWFVAESYRRRGVGTALLRAAEQWARDQGCTEMASDTWIDNELSQRAHEALGFEVVDRCVNYRKVL
jgi:aminoglycoside 6'-N-acetyltransferase I